jgi:tRNA(Ile)-lysidine synthase
MVLLEIAEHSIENYGLIPQGAVIVIGVSGGADSLALAHVLKHLSDTLGFRLHIATLDHQLRGQAGADDANFVVEMANSWDVSVTAGQMDVAKLAQERRIGIEAAARLARYQFLAGVAREIGASRIAVAHHANDQAETVLMRLIRGSGIQGLSGMAWSAPVPDQPDLTLIRPFLGIIRAQIETYCAENGLIPRQDATNSDTSLLRNHLRLETLPHLQKLNPQIVRSLTQLAEVAAAEGDYIQKELEKIAAEQVELTRERVRISTMAFRGLHPALQRRFIYWATQQLGSSETGHDHILAAVRLGLDGKTGMQSLLSGGLRLRVDYETLDVERMDALPPEMNIPLMKMSDVILVNIPGITPIPQAGWRIEARLTPLEGARLAIPEGSSIFLRTRRTGDRFAPLGLKGHTQKIKEWMIDHKIPKAVRDQIPLLVVNDEIAAIILANQWIIGESFAVRSDSQRVVYFAVDHGNC